MHSQKEILSTIDMIDHQHLDVRTITMGISLLDCCSDSVDKTCENILNKITTKARFVTAFVTILLLFGFVTMFNAFNINLLAR